jgi:threonine dehydratase
MAKPQAVTLQEIYQARQQVTSLIRVTPMIQAAELGSRAGPAVYLKLENLQATGSFKLRGAANKLASLDRQERERGVVTVSTGNHGRAVALAARELGIPATVCLSHGVPSNKIAAIKSLGAIVEISGESYDEAEAHAAALQKEQRLTLIEPFDDPQIIAGQGTIALEILETLPAVDTAVVPLSGGGLISGIAIALKAANPAIRVYGVSMNRAPVMYHSLRAGAPLTMPEEPTLADALRGGIGSPNRHTFQLVQQLVDETLLVTEDEIAMAMVHALQVHRQVVEGGGAVGLAAVLSEKITGLGRHVVVVISGGNVPVEQLLQLARDREDRYPEEQAL